MTDGVGPVARFAGKAALVTGAGSGIGRAVALRLAGESAFVLGVDVDGDALDETARLAGGARGEVRPHRADVSQSSQCRAAVAECVATAGKLDVLGNVAGVSRMGHVTDLSEADYRRMMSVNVDGYFFTAQAAIPHLLETRGNIVNIASVAGLHGIAYGVAYSMTKGAVVQLTRSLAMEFIRRPLRVNAIAPGVIDTRLVATTELPGDADGDLVMRQAGLRRGSGTPEDIAALFAFLASDEARNIHGTVIPSDRGITAG